MQNEELRSLFQERLGRVVDDETWDYVLLTEYDCDIWPEDVEENDPDAMVDRWVKVVRGLSSRSMASANLKPPASWSKFCHAQVVPRFRDYQLRCLGAFGLEVPIQPDELEALLEREASPGMKRRQALPVRERFDTRVDVIHFHGYSDGVSLGWKSVVFAQEDGSPISYLKATADRIREALDVPEEDVVTYLLADVPFTPGWLGYEGTAVGTLHMKIGSLEVKPEEVAAAYAKARIELREWIVSAEELEAKWLTRDYKRSADQHAAMIRHMAERMSVGYSKTDAAADWKRTHPDDKREVATLTKTFNRYARKGAL